MDEYDLYLARAARSLVKRNKSELATKLLSCRITGTPDRRESTSKQYVWVSVSIRCPREMYEVFWGSGEISVGYPDDSKATYSELQCFAQAFVAASGIYTRNIVACYVTITPEYGAANRSAAEQTELYMYVFGEDPIGQQVQVLDIGPHSAPTRQLIVSPVPVLPVADLARDGKLCFVAMPFAPQFRPVYDHAITRAVTASGMTCRRGDDISLPGAILSQIWQSMLQARLVVADVSGANGNVLYELGLAHVLGHEAILLTQNVNDVPFDLRHQRIITYGLDGSGLDTLRANLTAAIQSSLAVRR